MSNGILTNEMKLRLFKEGEVNAGIVVFKDSLHILGIMAMSSMMKHVNDYYKQNYQDVTIDISFPKGIDDGCDIIISDKRISFIMDKYCDEKHEPQCDDEVVFRLGYKNPGAYNILMLLETVGKIRYLDIPTLLKVNDIWTTTLCFSSEVFIDRSRHGDIKFSKFQYYKHLLPDTHESTTVEDDTTDNIIEDEDIPDSTILSVTSRLTNSKNLLTTHEIDSILKHEVGVGYTIRRIQNGMIRSDFSKDEKAHGKHYIALEELKKFLLSKDAIKSNKPLSKFDVDNIRKYLRLKELPEELDVKIRGVQIIDAPTFIEILDFVIQSPNTISIGDKDSPTYDDYHGQSVRGLKFRRNSIAHIVSHNNLNAENIIFKLTRDMFATMEELDVLEYMRGNLCDIIVLAFPELTYILEYIQFNDDDEAELVNYENKIIDFYPSEEEIYDIRIQDIESLFFKNVLSLKQFNNSMFSFVSSIYSNIDILKLCNLPVNEIPREYVINLVNKTLDKLNDGDKLKYITLIKNIHTGDHLL